MKLLFVHQANQIFGSENSLLGIFESAGDLVAEVVCKDGGKFADTLEARGIPTYRLEFGKYSLRQNPLWQIVLLLKLLKVFIKSQPDAIVINLEGNTLLVVIAAKILRLPIIRFCRFEFEPPGRWIDRWGWLSCDLVIGVSKLVREQIVSWAPGWFSNRVVHLYNPQAVPEITDAERAVLKNELVLANRSVIGFFGRLHPIKKVETLIDAAGKLSDKVPDSIFLVVGEAENSKEGKEYAKALHNRARNAGVEDRMLFLGHRLDVAALMSICDVIVLPSESESFGRVLVEAWSVRVPTLASDTSGCRELTRASNGGLLFPVMDSDALSQKLRWLLVNPEDASEFASHGQKWVEGNCSPEQYARKFLSYAGEVCRGASS